MEKIIFICHLKSFNVKLLQLVAFQSQSLKNE